MKTIFVLCAFLVAGVLGADGEEMKDKRGLVGFGYGLSPYGGYPGAGYVHGYHGYGYRGFGYPYDGYQHPYAYSPGALAYHGSHFGYGGAPFYH
ncbi:prisilkin-39-like [Phlebotomus argentipes]|uniref:prisilkin-39-like n=1 Tax=Phlebotomus argentipes TaxID=94469 RepID=UPI002893219A|nr:prisilkin-39-like [Phlebotomus argentipes]